MRRASIIGFAFSWGLVSLTSGQMIALEAPLHSDSHGFHERIGFNWGLNLPGSHRVRGLQPNGHFTPDGSIPFRFGGPNVTVAPFGGRSPNTDATLGIGWRGPNGGGGFFNAAFGQGNHQSLSSVTPSLTVTDGYPGMIFDGQVTPFVNGFVPDVGGNNVVPPLVLESPLRSKIARLQAGEGRSVSKPSSSKPAQAPGARPSDLPGSSAERGALSLTEIRAVRAAARRETERQLSGLIDQADLAERDGRLYAARQLLRRALIAANAEDRIQIAAKIERLNRLIASERTDNAR